MSAGRWRGWQLARAAPTLERIVLDTGIALAPLSWPEGGLPRPRRSSPLRDLVVLGFRIMWVTAIVGFVVAARRLFPIRALWDTGLHDLALESLLLVLVYVAVAVHELGHAVAARLVGFRLLAIAAGPLVVDRAGLRLAVTPTLVGGYTVPGLERWDGNRTFRRQYAWLVAAGPAASLVAGIGGGVIAIARATSGTAAPIQPLTATLWFGALISVISGLLALLPIGRSDGAKLRHLSQSSRQAIIALQLAAYTQRPRDWDERLLDDVRADIDHDDRDAIDGRLLLSYYYLDAGDPSRGRETLQQAIDAACAMARVKRGQTRLNRDIGIRLAMEAALFEAAWRGDFKAAGEWLARTQPTRAYARVCSRFRSAFAAAAEGHGDPSAPVREHATLLALAGLPAFQIIQAATIDRLARYAVR